MSVRYNEYVKEPGIISEYTPEMVKEIAECANNFDAFLKHIKIVHTDKGRIPYEPYEFQKELLKLIKENRFVVSLQCRQSGKCLFYFINITVRNKKTGLIEEIPIGDFFERIKNQ